MGDIFEADWNTFEEFMAAVMQYPNSAS